MDASIEEFVRRCDLVIAESISQESIWSSEGAQYQARAAALLREKVETLRTEALTGSLRLPSNGIGWGLGKAVGEFGYDTKLCLLTYDLELFYRDEM